MEFILLAESSSNIFLLAAVSIVMSKTIVTLLYLAVSSITTIILRASAQREGAGVIFHSAYNMLLLRFCILLLNQGWGICTLLEVAGLELPSSLTISHAGQD